MYCISGSGEHMFIVTLVFVNLSKGGLDTV